MTDTVQPDVTNLAVTLLSAYLSNNTVPTSELGALIETTKRALTGEAAPTGPAPQEFVPAVSVRKSLASREHIISMIDGKPYKTLKRHLSTHGLTPAEYRARYNLAHDYPLVAPAYSDARRETAKSLGLGRKPAVKTEAAAKPAAKAAPKVKAAPKAKVVKAEVKALAVAEAAKPVAAAKPKAAANSKAAAKPKAVSKPAASAPKQAAPAKAEANGAAPARTPRKKLGIAVPTAEVVAPKAA